MGYKILGYAVWNGVKWYLQGRVPGAARRLPTRKLAAAGLGAAAVAAAGAVIVQRRAAAS
jgi:hypothetical protein